MRLVHNYNTTVVSLFYVSMHGRHASYGNAHVHCSCYYIETGLLIFCTCTNNYMALLFINKVGESRRGLSIQLSGYPACLWNQGVRIIEVLLLDLLYCEFIMRIMGDNKIIIGRLSWHKRIRVIKFF